ncbi:MAG TPA: hypothetical protein VFA03_15835 [Acetobacteraceae bacterium]|nr:hypothetical protein [Acetobacteraceae bacterium]
MLGARAEQAVRARRRRQGAARPTVLRRLLVPVTIRLDRLHLVLQAAIGWTNSHLYEIRAGDVGWGMPDPRLRRRTARRQQGAAGRRAGGCRRPIADIPLRL